MSTSSKWLEEEKTPTSHVKEERWYLTTLFVHVIIRNGTRGAGKEAAERQGS